jgi:hypothetical protein
MENDLFLAFYKNAVKKQNFKESPLKILSRIRFLQSRKQKIHLIFCEIPKDTLGCRKKYL